MKLTPGDFGKYGSDLPDALEGATVLLLEASRTIVAVLVQRLPDGHTLLDLLAKGQGLPLRLTLDERAGLLGVGFVEGDGHVVVVDSVFIDPSDPRRFGHSVKEVEMGADVDDSHETKH